MSPSPRARAGAVLAAAVAVAVAVVAAAGAIDATASMPPSTAAVPAPAGGTFTDPSGSFEVRFTGAPTVVVDPDGAGASYLVGVEEDSETLSVLAPTAFGAAPAATATERVLLFLDASGDEVELVANTSTRLGPFPTAYFIARITLADGQRAVVYGAAVVRPSDISYVFYTDVGGDDADRARAFVESYAVTIDPLPAAPVSTSPPPPTIIPVGSTVSFDGVWWVRFPAGSDVSLRASSHDGFAYAEYAAVVGDDTLSVRVTELPVAIAWDPASAAAAEAERMDGTVIDSEAVTIGASPGARFSLADAASDTSSDVTEVLLVRAGGQLYRAAYVDAGDSSASAAADFISSFHLR